MDEFAEAFKLAVERSTMQQKDLARACGLHPSTISNIKTGRLRPKEDTVRAIEKTLGLTPGALLRHMRSEIESISDSGGDTANPFDIPLVMELCECTAYIDEYIKETDEIRYIRSLRPGITLMPQGVEVPSMGGKYKPVVESHIREGARLLRADQSIDEYPIDHLEFANPIPTEGALRYRLTRTVVGSMQSSLLVNPRHPYKQFILRLQFNGSRLPSRVQRVDGEPIKVGLEMREGREDLKPDRFGLVEVKPFLDLQQGVSYGATWSFGV